MRKRVPRLRIGVPVLVVGIVMIVSAAVYLMPLAPNGKLPPCFPQSCPGLAFYAFLGLAGFFVSAWGAIETILAALNRPGYLEVSYGPKATLTPGSGAEDEIVMMAREIHAEVKFPRRTLVEGIAWLEGQPWYGCRFKRRGISKSATMVLSSGLRGRLNQADWRVLLTYYFLSLKRDGRELLRTLTLLSLSFMLIPTGGILVSLLYGIRGGTFYGQFVAVPAAVLYLLFSAPFFKSLYLRQDRLVALSMGKDALLSIIKKIDSLQLPDVEAGKRRHGLLGRLWPVPNIAERMRNLTALR